ncbi:MAG: tRNA pseudouridine(55) synthase TruB [Chloroflexota bacterium]
MTRRSNSLFGFLNVDKPLGMTSHDVVARVRRASGIKKVGHAGTLDPLATGVLILCVGGATRLSEYVMHGTKHYRAMIRLGATTSTYDAEGEIVLVRDASRVTREDVERIIPSFLGEIEQIPPMYSAIKQGGKKLYEMAREGKTVEREARKVRIDTITLSDRILRDSTGLSDRILDDSTGLSDRGFTEFVIDVTCSAGTYIRSLAYDIGEVLGVGAHLTGLIRTGSGVFTLENAVTLDTLLTDPAKHLIAPFEALKDYPALVLDAAAEAEIGQGRAIGGGSFTHEAVVMAYDADQRLIAVLEAEDGRLKPRKVFNQRDQDEPANQANQRTESE